MIDKKYLEGYNKVFNEKFPGVVVIIDPEVGGLYYRDGEVFLGLFGLPEGQRIEFMKFCMEELPAIQEREWLPEYHVLSHTMEETKKHYPKIYDKYFKNKEVKQ